MSAPDAAPGTPMPQRLRDYLLLMRLDRPIGIWLLLWPTLWGLWVAAAGMPPLDVLIVFVLGTVLMRSAGCVINDIADRNVDPHVERTRDRPLAAGRVRVEEALRLFVVLCLIAFGLVARTNTLTMLLSLPAVALAASYPFAKRFHSLPQAHLGLAFAWGIPMGFAAVHGRVDWALATPLMVATVCWAIAYDTWYAMVDADDDRRIGVRSSALLFGRHAPLMVGLFHVATLVVLEHLGRELGYGAAWYAGLVAAAGLAAWQQFIARRDGAPGCFRAFLNNHWFGGAIFAGLLLEHWR